MIRSEDIQNRVRDIDEYLLKKYKERYPLQIKWKFEKHGIFANASFSGVITKHSRYVYRKIEIIE